MEVLGNTQQFARKIIIRLASAFIGACAYTTALKRIATKINSDLMLWLFKIHTTEKNCLSWDITFVSVFQCATSYLT